MLQVSRATGDRTGERDTLQNIANAHYFLRDFAAARSSYEERLALARAAGDADASGSSLLGLATVAYAGGDYVAALAAAREAEQVYIRMDDGLALGRTRVTIGNVQYLEADYDASAASYRSAIDLLAKGGDAGYVRFARAGLARLFAAQGDLGEALTAYGDLLTDARARAAADPRTRGDAASLQQSIGEIYFRLGDTDRARASFAEAQRIFDDLHDPENAGLAFSGLGLTELVATHFDAALEAYQAARADYEQARDSEGVAQAWVGTGFSQAARSHFTEAMTAYRIAIRLLDALAKEEASARAWLGLSMAQASSGDAAAALESAQQVRRVATRLANADLAWRGAVCAGNALRKLQRLGEAEQAFTAAIATIDQITAELPIDPSARGQLQDSASAYAGLAFVLAARGDAAGALAAAERRRAHVRRVDLASFERDLTRGEPDADRTAEQTVATAIVATRAQLRAEKTAPHPDAARLDRLNQLLTEALAKRTDQQQRLYRLIPELRRIRGLDPPDTAHALDVLVPDSRNVLVEYVVEEEETLVLTSAREGSAPAPSVTAVIVPLARAHAGEMIAKALEPASARDAGVWRSRVAPLAALLLDAVLPRLPVASRLIVIPDDVLWRLPFEALPAGDGDLADRVVLSYGTSLETLAAMTANAAPAASDTSGDASKSTSEATTASTAASSGEISPRALFVVAPELTEDARARARLTRPQWQETDRAAAGAEAHARASHYGDGGRVITGPAATEQAVTSAADEPDILDLGVTLQLTPAAPLLSSFLLAGAPSRPDGRWELRRWFDQAPGRTRTLIVGDGDAFAGGTAAVMDSLAWAAAARGISTIIAGRWPAEVFDTQALMSDLHARLAAGEPVDAAVSRTLAAARGKGLAPGGWVGLRRIGL